MRFEHLSDQIYCKPWLITAAAHKSICEVFKRHMDEPPGQKPTQNPTSDMSAMYVQRPTYTIDDDNIGHVYIYGIIGHRISAIVKSCGNTDVDDLRQELNMCAGKSVSGILLHINSPGGTTTGVPELADQIRNIRDDIPVVAFTDGQMCSAAYYIASAASQIVATESSEVGSIGVYIPWIDQSVAWGMQGIKADPIVNDGAIYKASGFGPALNDSQRSMLQQQVNRVAELFHTFVTQNRLDAGQCIDGPVMQGGVINGIDCCDFGAVDLSGDLQDAIEVMGYLIDYKDQQENEEYL